MFRFKYTSETSLTNFFNIFEILFEVVVRDIEHLGFAFIQQVEHIAAVFISFAFGTAAGDWTAGSLHLGNFHSGLLFAVLFALPAIAYWRFNLNAIFAFWFSYIMTRPLGASFADWIGKPASHGGLGYGTGSVCVVLTILILLFVLYLTINRKDDGSADVNARSSG